MKKNNTKISLKQNKAEAAGAMHNSSAKPEPKSFAEKKAAPAIKCEYSLELFRAFQEALREFRFAKDEYWRYSNLEFMRAFQQKTIADLGFTDAHAMLSLNSNELQEVKNTIRPFVNAQNEDILVFRNGILLEDQPFQLSRDIEISREAASFSEYGKKSEVNFPYSLRSIKKQNLQEANILVLLNSALASLDCKKGEVFIKLSEEQVSKKALHLIFIDSPEAAERVTSPRVHITLEKKAELKLMETHLGEHALLANTFLGFHLAAEAKLHHLYANFAKTAYGVHFVRSLLRKNSELRSFTMQNSFGQGGAHFSCVQQESFLKDTNAKIDLHGFFLGKDKEEKDFIIQVNHEKPETYSNQQYKGILRDFAQAAFTGSVKVFKDAQKIESEQLSKTLVLGDDAKMRTRPQLEILADDVKCGHGATIGQLDADELFYLQSRGLSKKRSEEILFLAFIEDFSHEVLNVFPNQKIFQNQNF